MEILFYVCKLYSTHLISSIHADATLARKVAVGPRPIATTDITATGTIVHWANIAHISTSWATASHRPWHALAGRHPTPILEVTHLQL